jgi:hypothetical protein
MLIACFICCSTMNMEDVRSSETSGNSYQTYMAIYPSSSRRENLKLGVRINGFLLMNQPLNPSYQSWAYE